MSGKKQKKIRQVMRRLVKNDFEDLSVKLSELRLYWRLVYAIRIIFRYNPKIKFETKRTVNK